MSLSRVGRLLAKNISSRISTGASDTSHTGRALVGPSSTGFSHQTRWMSGGHHGPGVTYEGLTLHKPARWHKVTAEGFTALMWFWIFVRAYHDGSTLLFGHAQHFEHDDHKEASEDH